MWSKKKRLATSIRFFNNPEESEKQNNNLARMRQWFLSFQYNVGKLNPAPL
jgi:hypothetical protein